MADRTDRVLKKLKLSLENGDYYSAHQMYLTVCTRYVKAKKIDQAVDLLTTGAKLLCEHKQYGSALELAVVILKTWTEESVSVTEQNLGLLLELLDLFAADSKEFFELAKHGIKWTAKCGDHPTGEPALHHHIGASFAEVGKINEAQKYFLQGTQDSAESFAVMLVKEGCKQGLSANQLSGMCMAPVLQYLASLKIAYALTFFTTFARLLEGLDPEIWGTEVSTTASSSNHFMVYKVSVLNFVQLIILTCQRGPAAAQGYMALCKQYMPSSPQGADAIQDLIERVGESVFGIQSAKAQPNVLQNLMASLLGGGGGGM